MWFFSQFLDLLLIINSIHYTEECKNKVIHLLTYRWQEVADLEYHLHVD